ncbi:hypothetical protein PG987_000108 [Apiospora arundinis]
MEELDLVVIGAGLSGLAAAKNFHQLNPEKSLVILEAASSLGGTWAKDRLYPGLKSNNMLGTYEYPDFPMDSKIFNVNLGEHIPGNVLHEYLTQYAERFDVLQAIRYGHRVSTVEHRGGPEGGWTLTTQDTANTAARFIAKKLVVATGLTSQPFMPDYKGQEGFGVPLFHSRDFLKNSATIDTAKSVTVFGGTKSSWDAVYAYAIKGVHVDWVIRDTRLLTWFSPCAWGTADGYTRIRNFLHGTAFGRKIVDAFWNILGNDVITLNQYDKHPEVKKLKPWSQAMFTASSFSILNYPTDFFDLVKNGTVAVHIADIDHLSPQTVHLSNGISFQTDAFMSTTGWRHAQSIKYIPEGIDMQLGIPIASTTLGNAEDAPIWTIKAVDNADREILSRFPRLKNQPTQNKTLQPLLATPGVSSNQDDATVPSVQSYTATPYHLYRFMVPVAEHLLRFRDIAFAGAMMNFSVAPIAHLQSLWINAYFHDKLPAQVLPPLSPCTSAEEQEESKGLDELRYETVLHARFGKWRYPAGHGAQFPDFVFDALPYMDLLVGDLGLRVHRKAWWLAEVTEPVAIALLEFVILLGALYKLDLGLAVAVAVAVAPGALDRYNRGLGDAVAAEAGPAGAAKHLRGVLAAARADVLGAARLEAAEEPRHAWHAGADDADVEFHQRPHRQLRIVHRRVRAESPVDEGVEPDHAAYRHEEADQEGEDDTHLFLP